jgi:hypothetical protein
MRRLLTLSAAVIVAAGVVPAVVGTAAQASSPGHARTGGITVLASHLNNPRGLAWGSGGLYVAEAGRGGAHYCATDPSGSTNCVGLTGSLDRVRMSGGVTRLTRGLVSVSGPGGMGAEGPVAVSVDQGQVYGQFFGASVEVPPAGFPNWLLKRAKAQLGQLGVVQGRAFRPLVGVGDHDFAWTAKHQDLVPAQFPDANPNGLYVHNGVAFVADAGANAMAVAHGGHSWVAEFMGTPSNSVTDAVITCVAPGPDHALYLGELLGGYYDPGHARVWKVWRDDGHWKKQVWLRGFTTIQGCGFDGAGNFYATEFQTGGLNEDPTASPLGAVVKVSPTGQRTELGVGQLFWPSGLAVGPRGQVYVSNCSISPGAGFGPCPNGGQVVRVQ